MRRRRVTLADLNRSNIKRIPQGWLQDLVKSPHIPEEVKALARARLR